MAAPYQTGLRGRQVAYRMRLDPGTYSYTGMDLSFPQRMSLDRGTYSYTGLSVALQAGIADLQENWHLSGATAEATFTQTLFQPFFDGSKVLALVTYRGDVVQHLLPDGAVTSVVYTAFNTLGALMWTQSAVQDGIMVGPTAYGPNCEMWRLDNSQSSAGVAVVKVTVTFNKPQWMAYYVTEYVGVVAGGPLVSTGDIVTGSGVYPTAGPLTLGASHPFLLYGGFNAFSLRRSGSGAIDPTPPPGFTDLDFFSQSTNVDGPTDFDVVQDVTSNYSDTITWGSIFGSPYTIAHGCTALINAYAGVVPA